MYNKLSILFKMQKQKIIIFFLIILTSCNKKDNIFQLNLDSFLETKQESINDICKLNSLIFYKDFIKIMNENADVKIVEEMAQKILFNQRNYELVEINLDFNQFEKEKNHTFKWGNLNGILSKNIKEESEDFYYSDFYIKYTQLFAQFNKYNNNFTGKIYSYSDRSTCIFPLKKI